MIWRGMRPILWLAAFCIPANVAAASPAATAAPGPTDAGSAAHPIRITADNGLEWQSKASQVVARGHAKATRGAMTVTADTLTALYHKKGGGNEIWRLDADGHVVITNPSDTGTGDHGHYNLDTDHFVLHGQPARLVTPTESFQAWKSLDYWELQRKAVLTGDATAASKGRTLKGDTLIAYFVKAPDEAARGKPVARAARTTADSAGVGGNGQLRLHLVDAFGHVVLTTPQESVSGDRGHYNAETGIVTMTGSVKITKGKNVLNGGYARVDLNTGISRLFGGPPGSKGASQRVRGVLVPKKQANSPGAGPDGATGAAVGGAKQ